jgi:hypothetical protein
MTVAPQDSFKPLPLCHSVTLSLCHSVTLSLCHSVTLSLCHFVTLSLCHFVSLARRLAGSVFVALSAICISSPCLSISLSLYPSIRQSANPPICLSVCQCASVSVCLSVYLSFCVSVYLPICLSVYLSVGRSHTGARGVSQTKMKRLYLFSPMLVWVVTFPLDHSSLPSTRCVVADAWEDAWDGCQSREMSCASE